MIIDELDYIQHFGIKGQRWGVRKKRESSEESSSTPRSNTKRNLKIGAAVVGVAATVAVGAVFTHKFLNSNGHQTVRDMQRSLEGGTRPKKQHIESLLKQQNTYIKYLKLLGPRPYG